MIKTYSLKKDGEIQLSPNFKVKEWKCKDGSDKILIDIDIVPFLENIKAFFNCKSANIYSGYRTPAHDKKSGGSGSGSHTKGYAVDIKFIGKDGKYISSHKICCYAKDIGMKGVAKCSTYGVHLDVKPRNWYADETKRVNGKYKTVSDFYTYFGLTKKDIYGDTAVPTSRDETKDQIEVKKLLNARISPSTSYMSVGKVSVGQVYDYFASEKDSKYIWYKIGTNQWVADNGTYLNIYPKKVAEPVIEEPVVEPIIEPVIEEIKKEEPIEEPPSKDLIILILDRIIEFFRKIFKG